LLAWREEQAPIADASEEIVGDMPHNWASAEFIRAVMHLLVLERGNELHLLEGLPPTWLKSGAEVSIRNALTRFGLFSMTFRVSKNGAEATLNLELPRREPPKRVVVHTGDWARSLMLNAERLTDGREMSVSSARSLQIKLDMERDTTTTDSLE
jgi:hypothetical protein